MKENQVNTWIQFHPLNPEEAKLHRPIYLDITEEGILLQDKGGFMETILMELKKKLSEMGAKRVFLRDSSWYWDLKPNIRRGEVLEI